MHLLGGVHPVFLPGRKSDLERDHIRNMEGRNAKNNTVTTDHAYNTISVLKKVRSSVAEVVRLTMKGNKGRDLL